MDRCAIFVDAGYLLAAGGTLCCGTPYRLGLRCDYKELANALADLATKHSNLAVLRTYWYDGARNAVPTYEHLQVAELPYVKLRLGRLSGGEQKGVDSLIVRDFMTLARERAMVTAYLLAGDEDLREGVLAAQDMGVRVVVLGIAPTDDNQAGTLIRESDEHVILERGFLAPHFSKVETPVPPVVALPSHGDPSQVGADFATSWASKATSTEVFNLLGQSPRIPPELDIQLIVYAEQSFGSLRGRDDVRWPVRAGFWKALREAAANIAKPPSN